MIVFGPPPAPDDGGIVALEGHHVPHPAEQARHEAPSRGAARLRGRNRRLRAEQRLPIARLAPPLSLAPGREAPVHVLMPPRHGQGNPLVERVVRGAAGVRVYRYREDERFAGALPVQSLRGPGGILPASVLARAA